MADSGKHDSNIHQGIKPFLNRESHGGSVGFFDEAASTWEACERIVADMDVLQMVSKCQQCEKKSFGQVKQKPIWWI